jgi:hypothetical protein
MPSCGCSASSSGRCDLCACPLSRRSSTHSRSIALRRLRAIHSPAAGERVDVYWQRQSSWYSGVLSKLDRASGSYTVDYDDGDVYAAQSPLPRLPPYPRARMMRQSCVLSAPVLPCDCLALRLACGCPALLLAQLVPRGAPLCSPLASASPLQSWALPRPRSRPLCPFLPRTSPLRLRFCASASASPRRICLCPHLCPRLCLHLRLRLCSPPLHSEEGMTLPDRTVSFPKLGPTPTW